MTSRLRQLAEHLSTMETGWRRYAWATVAGLFTALGATAYSLEQSWFGATFFVFAVALLVMSGWSRWYLRTHRPPVRYVGELGPEVVPAGGVMTASAVNRLQDELHWARAARDRVIAEHQPGLGGGGCPLCGVPHPCWTNRELTRRPHLAPGAPPMAIRFDRVKLDPEQIADFKRRVAESAASLRTNWLPPTATPESSPPPTDFPGVEGGEIHSTEDGAHPDLINLDTGDEYEWVGEGYAHEGDHDFAWSREDLLKTGDRLVEVDSLDMADLLELRERYADGAT